MRKSLMGLAKKLIKQIKTGFGVNLVISVLRASSFVQEKGVDCLEE